MDALQIVFWGVVTFSILVLLHEGGHFVAARMFGVKVHEFMLGLPGPAVRLRIGETYYGVTAIPLGGYVRIAGMEPGDEDPLLADALALATRSETIDAPRLAEAAGIDIDRAVALLDTLADWYAIEALDINDPSKAAMMFNRGELYRSLQDPEMAANPTKMLDAARKRTYRGLSTTKRILVLCAGVAVNLLSAILVFTVVLSAFGYYEQSLTVTRVVKESAAETAGLKPGDTITGLGGKDVDTWQDFLQRMALYQPGDETSITFERDGASKTAEVTLGEAPEGDRPFLGVQPTSELIKPNILQALGQSFVWLGMVFVAIGQFFNPQTFQVAVSGARSIVGISVEVRNAAAAGALSYAWIVALLSLSLGAMNILPIPPLDGGKVLMEIIERLIGHPVSRRVSLSVSVVGMLVLFSLIGYLMYADVMRYIVNG
ncbi:MAG: site-2 protease family protein [Coriobacteriales bacterium]|nr:site-2 protease family protein [Coriobacteriales bacterium]